MFHDYSYTDFHELNLDYLMCLCKKNTGLKLDVQGDYLRLLNGSNEVVSKVQISYAEKALKDIDGRPIQTYIFSAGVNGDTIVFTHGDDTVTSITIPYAEKAKYDLTGHELEDYVYNLQVAGNKLRITKGDGTISEITVPFATAAETDVEGKDLTTYAATLEVDGTELVLRDSKGRVLSRITVDYANKALKDDAGNEIKASYGSVLDTGTTTVKLISKSGITLSEITIPFATHATTADSATVATDATNAIESVAINGDNIIFTTYGGTQTTITAPYAVKAQKDDLNNVIKSTYVANVTTDAQTGEITFLDATGAEIVTIIPTVNKATHDSYNNLIADYVKQILVDSGSNYVTVTHGTGDTDTLVINYATHAWKDTNDNVIKNFYISYLECVEDVNDGHYKIVAYDGDTPRAELFRFEVTAYAAQTDVNGKALTSYVADVNYNANKEIEVTDGAGTVIRDLSNEVADIADVNISSVSDGDVLKYDAISQKWVNGAVSAGIATIERNAQQQLIAKDSGGNVLNTVDISTAPLFINIYLKCHVNEGTGQISYEATNDNVAANTLDYITNNENAPIYIIINNVLTRTVADIFPIYKNGANWKVTNRDIVLAIPDTAFHYQDFFTVKDRVTITVAGVSGALSITNSLSFYNGFLPYCLKTPITLSPTYNADNDTWSVLDVNNHINCTSPKGIIGIYRAMYNSGVTPVSNMGLWRNIIIKYDVFGGGTGTYLGTANHQYKELFNTLGDAAKNDTGCTIELSLPTPTGMVKFELTCNNWNQDYWDTCNITTVAF